MSEDVSATMRVGITVILVAALVATVLNLMVMSNSLLTGGQTTLQSGIDSVSQQEFAAYNNTKVSGTQVNTALSLFQGRDVAICIQTKTFKELVCGTAAQGEGYFMNYGAIISSSQDTSMKPSGWTNAVSSVSDAKDTNDKSLGNITILTTTPVAGGNGTSDKISATATDLFQTGATYTTTGSGTDTRYTAAGTNPKTVSISGATVGNYYVCGLGTGYADGMIGTLTQKAGAPNFQALLWDSNGIVQSNNNVIGCSTLGNPQYLLSSARFQSVLIKDSTGSIIGIAFYQI